MRDMPVLLHLGQRLLVLLYLQAVPAAWSALFHERRVLIKTDLQEFPCVCQQCFCLLHAHNCDTLPGFTQWQFAMMRTQLYGWAHTTRRSRMYASCCNVRTRCSTD